MVNTPNSYYRISSSGREPLRIGLLLDSQDQVPAFLARIIQDIQASNFARIECLVVTETASPGSSARLPRKSGLSDPGARKHLLYDLYLRLDARMNPGNDPLAMVDTGALLSGIEALEAESVEKIRSKSLDVLLHFGHGILPGDILKAARCGVWSYHHGDNEFYRGVPSYFWEMREGSPLSGVVLEVPAREAGSGLALCKSLFATERTLSLSRNRYTPYWGSTALVIQKLNELHRFGWEYVLARALPPVPYQGKRAAYEIPSNREMLSWLGPILLKKAISYPFRRERVQHWRIALHIGGTPLGEMASTDVSGFRWINSPQGHFWADPFPFEHEGKCWVFFEDYSYRAKRGSIACAEISPESELGPPVPCLHHPSRHYSYPHIFRAGSEIFMIPESFDSESVDLYRCQQFPHLWVREATLLEGKFVDTTIWEHEGLWWLATTTADPHPGAGCLLLFYSESLTGDWHFHPANPISTDIRRNRGAGRVFRSQDRLIRPSQSCAPTYGYSVDFNEITELSRERYSERPLKTITAGHWAGLTGVHTYNRAGKVEFIDGRTPVPLKRGLR